MTRPEDQHDPGGKVRIKVKDGVREMPAFQVAGDTGTC